MGAIPMEVPTITREYVIRVRMELPEGTDLVALDAAVAEVLDGQGAAFDIEDALYYGFPEITQAIFEDGRFGVRTFTLDPEATKEV